MFDTGKNISYEYDSLNRLTKETNLAIGSEWRYTYDNGGNITRKEEYNPSTGALRSSRDYGYGHSYWKDQLTSWGSYGTNSFVYDDSGNPTKYKGKTLEWEGKRLARYNESDNCYVKLNYDGNGLLAGYFYSNTYSIWGGATFTTTMTREILRDGDRILSEKVTEYNPETNSTTVKNIMYAYDEKGVSGMTVGGKKYYFVRNIFGDVTAIYNTSRVKCAEYAYDAWGTMYITLDTEGVGTLNPFRYRGYYMVSCIGLYYLTTRFYDYMTGRFLNADVPSKCFENGVITPEGCNLYAYCRNNPIMNVDPTGHEAISIAFVSVVIMLFMVIYIELLFHPLQNLIEFICQVFNKIGSAWNELLWGMSKWEPGTWPGDDATKAPGDGFVWRGPGEIGSDRGEWYDPETGDQLHPDLNHKPPKGPHWGWKNKLKKILQDIFKIGPPGPPSLA